MKKEDVYWLKQHAVIQTTSSGKLGLICKKYVGPISFHKEIMAVCLENLKDGIKELEIIFPTCKECETHFLPPIHLGFLLIEDLCNYDISE